VKDRLLVSAEQLAGVSSNRIRAWGLRDCFALALHLDSVENGKAYKKDK
jgi:hypothetical protein